eukprot:1154555-Pelagomonas_calceolata.AAC.2
MDFHSRLKALLEIAVTSLSVHSAALVGGYGEEVPSGEEDAKLFEPLCFLSFYEALPEGAISLPAHLVMSSLDDPPLRQLVLWISEEGLRPSKPKVNICMSLVAPRRGPS